MGTAAARTAPSSGSGSGTGTGNGHRAKLSRTTDALISKVTQHHRAISAHQQQMLGAVAELERRKAWRADGATSMVSWLVQRCGISAQTAREYVTAAQKLEGLPKIKEALGQGKLSFDQVKPLVEVAKPETDAKLAEQAPHWSAKQVRELAIDARRESDAQAAGSFGRRFLRFDDRRRTFSGMLPADQYAKVKGALVRRASGMIKNRAPFDARMADALVETCEGGVPASGAGAGGGSGKMGAATGRSGRGTRPTLVVHADFSYLAGGEGGAEIDVLGPLAVEAARRLACDAKVLVSLDDKDGLSVRQGRARRSPSDSQRIEIRRRDRGCRFPGCTHTEFTEAHHVVHWASGGATELSNLAELCDQHHRSIHEMGWSVSGDANVELRFVSPTGRVTTSRPSPTFGGPRARDGPPG
ncbi:MAG TPA: DUF222 domain-containing protein [Acidimicrobiales bacterium]